MATMGQLRLSDVIIHNPPVTSRLLSDANPSGEQFSRRICLTRLVNVCRFGSMKTDNDNLLQSLLPDLEDHLAQMKAELSGLDGKRNELGAKIRDLEQKVDIIKVASTGSGGKGRSRQPRG